MNVEEVFKFTDALVFNKMGKRLNDLQRLLIQTAWSKPGQCYDQIAEATGYSTNYLKQDAGPKLWLLLSDVFGEKVKKSNFRAAMERQAGLLSQFSSAMAILPVSADTTALQEFSLSAQSVLACGNAKDDRSLLTSRSLPRTADASTVQQSNDEGETVHQAQICTAHQCQDWGEAPDVSIFFDRSDELATLEQWIVSDSPSGDSCATQRVGRSPTRCRLVALLGMGGIGKTHLSVKLAERIQEQFDYVIWRSLCNAPTLQQILTSLLQGIANTQETDLPATVEEKLSLLIDYLRKHRCLLVLDNFETILRGGDCAGFYKQGYEDYGDFLKRLGEGRHNSCLVLTAREKPKEIALMQGETLPVRCLKLQGLSTSAGRQLLQLKGCYWNSDAECRAFIEQYSANPLALKIVAAAIQELFEGNLSDFINYNTLVFDEIRAILSQQFNRLPDLGKTVLYWLAINREPVSIAELKSDIYPHVTQQTLIETLKSLVQRSLIEKKGNQFLLQPVVMEYASSLLIERVCQEIETGELVLLNSHALFKAEAKDYIRQTQINFSVQPLIDRLRAIFKTQSNLEIRLGQIISKLQAQPTQESGYAAGNILNLLCQLQTDLSSYEFSHLKVWQAYLQDVNLHDVNFTGADLAKSVFAQQLTQILSVAFSPDGRMLATGDANGEIRLLQVANSKLLLVCKGHAGWVNSVAFSPDGRLLSSASNDQTLKLWDARDGRCLTTLGGHNQRVRSVAFSPDGKILASGSSDCTVKLWDARDGRCLKTLLGHTRWVRSVAFSPDGTTLVSCGDNNTLKLWDVHTGECLKTWRGHSGWLWSVAFSPDGVTVASASEDKTVKLWDVRTGECLKTLEGHTSWVQSVAFSPDGKALASGSCDQTVKLWDVSTGKCWQTLSAHASWIWSLAFSPDSKALASGGEDETIKLWDVNDGECLETLRSKRPYEGMRLTKAQSLTPAQLVTLKGLGAVE